MTKYILRIDGMMCGMCESHINDALRTKLAVKQVSSSHKRGTTEIIADKPLDEDRIRKIIESTGYTLLSVSAETYEKKAFAFFKR